MVEADETLALRGRLIHVRQLQGAQAQQVLDLIGGQGRSSLQQQGDRAAGDSRPFRRTAAAEQLGADAAFRMVDVEVRARRRGG